MSDFYFILLLKLIHIFFMIFFIFYFLTMVHVQKYFYMLTYLFLYYTDPRLWSQKQWISSDPCSLHRDIFCSGNRVCEVMLITVCQSHKCLGVCRHKVKGGRNAELQSAFRLIAVFVVVFQNVLLNMPLERFETEHYVSISRGLFCWTACHCDK